MDFDDTHFEAEYRARARLWLAANAPEFAGSRGNLEPGSPALAAARAWQRRKADAGYACITWPEEWGGQGGTAILQVIFSQEESAFDLPENAFHVSLGTCVPAMMMFGDEESRRRFGPPAVRGDEIWCQLFSEPSGGSDLAGVRTRAVAAADGSGDWILSGQKTWTTFARFSDFGLILCRTDPDAPKHRGLTMFRVDMRDPGIEVRPIHQMSGRSSYNDVFLADVRIPDANRVGGRNDGWNVALKTLMTERFAITPTQGPKWSDLWPLARDIERSAGPQPAFRAKMAEWYVTHAGVTNIRNRMMSALSRGEAPGPESTLIKLILGQHIQDLVYGSIDVLDQYGIVVDDARTPEYSALQRHLLAAPGLRIAGGTDEILKNIVAERILGLPGDIRTDREVPFRDVPFN